MGNCSRKKPQQNSTILSEEEIRLLLQNTKLDRKEINDLHANFLQTCPSGRMTKKDFVRLFNEVHPAQPGTISRKPEKFCDYVFKVIDRKNKGYISFEDFVLCLSLTSHGDFREKCEFAFKLYDLDRDGKITKSEMTKVLTALYDLSGIQNRKGENAPAKKVDEIINKINAQKYPARPGEKVKQPNFITRDQFIDACCNDSYIKNLFMDPIFVFNKSPTTPSPAPVPVPVPIPVQPQPSPQVIHKPVVDVPTIYIESRPNPVVVTEPVVYQPTPPTVHKYSHTAPQVIIDEKPLALYLDEKETFDFVDKYLAEFNSRKTVNYVSNQEIILTQPPPQSSVIYHERKSSNPTGIDIDIKPVLSDYSNDHHHYELRYSNPGLNRSSEDLRTIRQEIKHLI